MRKAACLALALASGCSGGSGNPGGPSPAPAPTATSITVTLRDVVLVGTTAVASGTAALSNGQSQAVTTGWRSDATSVASVTDSGTVTGVANGEANIYVVFGGVQGARRVRVAPNYDGTWTGTQQITSCTATGAFEGFCDGADGFVGELYPIGLTGRHPGDLVVSGEFTIEHVPFPTFTAQVEGDGAIAFSGTLLDDGIQWAASWRINSTHGVSATGTIREVFSAPGIVSGEIEFVSTLATFTRGGAGAAPLGPSRQRVPELRSRLRTLIRR